MDRIVVICILVLLSLTDKGTAETRPSEEASVLRKLENLDIDIEEGDDEVEFFEEPFWISERGSKVLVNVDSFGAVGDGVADDTKVNALIIIIIILVFFLVLGGGRNRYVLLMLSSPFSFIC